MTCPARRRPRPRGVPHRRRRACRRDRAGRSPVDLPGNLCDDHPHPAPRAPHLTHRPVAPAVPRRKAEQAPSPAEPERHTVAFPIPTLGHTELLEIGFLTAAYLLWFRELGCSWALHRHLQPMWCAHKCWSERGSGMRPRARWRYFSPRSVNCRPGVSMNASGRAGSPLARTGLRWWYPRSAISETTRSCLVFKA